jgi:hypothetical protein
MEPPAEEKQLYRPKEVGKRDPRNRGLKCLLPAGGDLFLSQWKKGRLFLRSVGGSD